MEKTWIVVADSSRARIFYAANRVKPLTTVAELNFPESHLREQDIYTDRPGRLSESASENRGAIEQPDIREQQQQAFAREICETLDAGRNQQRFAALMVIAPPGFLGALRQNMNHQLEKMVDKSVQKNLVNEEEARIREYLFH